MYNMGNLSVMDDSSDKFNLTRFWIWYNGSWNNNNNDK